MDGLKRFKWCWVGLLVMVVGGLLPALAAQVKEVRVSSNSTRTRAVLDLSNAVNYNIFQLSAPNRVVLDIDNSQAGKALHLPGNVGLIKDIRTGKHGSHGLRVVLDIKSSAKVTSFLLSPSGRHGHRLVVDLVAGGASAKTTTAAVIAGKKSQRQSEQQAAELLGGARKVVIAIDPGHGGRDSGAIGHSGLKEKNVTLAVGLKLAKLVDSQPGMTAVMTRKTDIYVPLKERYHIARENGADLFISIHADAYKSSDAKGSSVWVLSTHGKVSQAARWLANRQNSADLLGGVTLDDKSNVLASVLLDLQQSYAIQASDDVANDVLSELAKLGPTHRGYVEHANFVVLRSPDVPSILVETAFITNPNGERKLRSSAYQSKLANAILSGVRKYFQTALPPGTWFAMQARRKQGKTVQHKIISGDTLSGIAHQYGVSVGAIKQANHMADNVIRKGAILTIPSG